MLKSILRTAVLLSIVGIGYSLFHIFSYANEYKTAGENYDQLRGIHELSGRDAFDALLVKNDDYIGWLSVEGTKITYPIVKGSDNDFYLDHNFYKENDRVGAIFMDHRNTGPEMDNHTIIYGHNMKDKSMFGTLTNVLENDFTEKSRIRLELKNETYEWKIFSAYVTRDTDWMQTDYESTDTFRSFKKQMIHNSTKDFSQKIDEEKMLTLATCTTRFSDERVIVHAKLVEGN